jgi:hypothetical protein
MNLAKRCHTYKKRKIMGKDGEYTDKIVTEDEKENKQIGFA